MSKALCATTARHNAKKHFWLTYKVVTVSHYTQVACPSKFSTEPKGRAIDSRDKDNAASVHL